MRLTAGGNELDLSSDRFGFLADSTPLIPDADLLRQRMETDGYLFLPGFLDRNEVVAARHAICEELAKEDLLDPESPVDCAIAKKDLKTAFRRDIANNDGAGVLIRNIIYGERVMNFFSHFLGGEATHYDFTWMRTVSPGVGSPAHCDIIFMGRGTKHLYTAWVPFGDIPLHVGGLLLVEGSHHNEQVNKSYCTMDYDTACHNPNGKHPLVSAGFYESGAISDDMPELRNYLGGRFLTAEEYKMGDILIFSTYLVHGSLDNASDQIRLSTDSRYQLASEPLDERWVGEKPPGHGGESVKNVIC